MSRHNQLTMEDALDYVRGLEEVHSCLMVLELRVGGWGYSGEWLIHMKAYQSIGAAHREIIASKATSFPSRHHKTLAGAVMHAAYDMESRLSAQLALTQLPLPLEE